MTGDEKQLFGERMRQARDMAGLTNRQIAERLAKSATGTPEWYSELDTLRRNLRRWLRGHNKPSADIVISYAEITGVSPQFFHTGNPADRDVMAPLMKAIEAVIDSKVEGKATRLREVVRSLPSSVHPLDAVGQACVYAHGRVLVASAEVAAGNTDEAGDQLDYAIARLTEAIENAKAAA